MGGRGELLGVVAFAALLGAAGCEDLGKVAGRAARGEERPDAPAPDYKPEAPEVEGPRIDATPIPRAPAFVGGEGVDAHGYPLKRPDQVALLNLLYLKRFDTLEQWMSHYQAEFERDYRKEDWPDAMVSAFFVADPRVTELLDAWVQASPKHFAPWVARGNHRYKMAQHYRGGKWAHQTSRAQFASMDAYHLAAARDFRRALELSPKLVAAHRRLLQMARSTRAVGDEREILDLATRECRLCYTVRKHYMTCLTPRWGGSLARMRGFAREALTLAAQNPKLAMLAGFPHWEVCRSGFDEDPKAALAECDEALALGPTEPAFLLKKASLLDADEHSREVMDLLDRALRAAPQDRDALRDRYRAKGAAKDYLGAAEDLIVSRHLAPTDDAIAKDAKWLVDMLRYEGDQRRQAGRGNEAARYFRLALQLAPDDNDLRNRAGWALKGSHSGDVGKQLAARPDDYELRLQRDHALAVQGKFGEVVVMWDEFIERHPDDPRPYRERGGAKWHLRRAGEAVADMQKACDLGLEKACQDASKMRQRMGR